MTASDIAKLRMPERFLLIEGIDGSGKDTFAELCAERIKARFAFHPAAPLSIVGQPAFRFDPHGMIRRLIEHGEADCPFDMMCDLLTENRRRHEAEIAGHRGITICIRGLLTDLATLARVYGRMPGHLLGQGRAIDRLIVVDVDPDEACERIRRRGRLPDWRETPENLRFFRDFYRCAASSVSPHSTITVGNTGSVGELDRHAARLIEDVAREGGNADQ